MEKEQVRLHATVEGRVQGVGFRMFVLETAVAMGLTGWARNRWSGSVEVLAEGPRAQCDQLLAALRRGPRAALVTQVQHEWQAASGEFHSFQVRSTIQ